MTHDEFHNFKTPYVAGGLGENERAAVEQHAAACAACAASLEQAEAADRELDDLFAAARPGDGLEDRVITHLRAAPRPPITLHPLVRKAAVGVAAAILLGGVGYAVTQLEPRMRVRDASNLRQVAAGQSLSSDEDKDGSRKEALNTPAQLALQLGQEIDAERNQVRSLAGERRGRFYADNWRDSGGVADVPGRQGQAAQQPFGSSPAGGRGEQRVKRSATALGYRFDGDADDAPQRAAAGQSDDTPAAGVAPETPVLSRGVSPATAAPQPPNTWDAKLRETNAALSGTEGPAARQDQAGEKVQSEFVPARSEAEQSKDSTITDLRRTRERLVEEGRHTEGAAVADQLGVLESKNAEAADAQERTKEAVVAGKPVAGVAVETVEDGAEPKIPYEDLLRQPTDWPDVSEPRTEAGEAAAAGRRASDAPQAAEGEVVLGRRATVIDKGTAGERGTTPPRLIAGADRDDLKQQAGRATAAGQPANAGNAGNAVDGAVAAVTAPQPLASQQADRKIIRNGEMTFEVDGYDSAVLQITKIAAEEGGFVATTESEKLPNGKVKGSVVVRCPPERLDTLVLKLRGLGDLRSSRVSAQDVTKQYTDLDAQLRAAKTMEQRLLEIIKGGKGEVKDLIEAEKQLGSWREKIEKLEGEIRYYNNLVSLSTLTVTLAERDVRAAALLSETEQVNMGIEAADVERARAEAIKAVEEAKGRIVESDLKAHDSGQFAATIAADVSPDRAGAVIDRLKQLGRVARLEVQRRQATAEGTGAPAPGARVERKDTRLLLSIYNLANVAARNKTDLHLAAEDVEKSYRAILAQVESAGGRVINSQLTKPTPQQTTGTIAFEVPTGGADVLLDAVRGAGEVVRLETSTNPDTQNVTDAKRAFSVQVRSVTTIPARESVSLQLAVDDVAGKYDKLLHALRGAGARVVESEINQQDANQTMATLEVEARREQRDAVDKALADAGGVYGRAVSRPAEGEAALEDKVRLSVTMHDVDHLAPRETTTLGVEAADVTRAASDMESTAVLLGGRKVDSDWAQQPGGQSVARVVVDVPIARAAELIDKARGHGRVLTVQRDQNPSSPEGSFARARLSVTFATADPIVQRDQSLAGSIRSGLATSVQWLLRSVTLVVIGLCLIGPWALIAWLAWKVVKRRRARDNDDAVPPAVPGAPAPVGSSR